MPALGIDIGGSSVKAALIDGGERVTARSRSYQRPSRDGLAGCVREAVALLGEPIDEAAVVGLCLPGKQSEAKDRVVRANNLPCLEDWAFAEMLPSVLGWRPARFRVVSDIAATAAGVVRSDGLGGRVAVLAIGTGVGFAMVEDGVLQPTGGTGLGSLGQLCVGACDGVDRFDAAGGRNTLEAFVGLRALRESVGSDDEETLIRALHAMTERDPFVIALSRALRAVLESERPETVVLAGGMGMALHAQRVMLHAMGSDGAGAGWTLRLADSLYHAASGAAALAPG